jgi:hypothetical protein
VEEVEGSDSHQMPNIPLLGTDEDSTSKDWNSDVEVQRSSDVDWVAYLARRIA